MQNCIQDIDQQFEEEYSKVHKINNVLNKIGNDTSEGSHSPLIITQDDKFIYYKLIKIKYNYLKDF